MPSLLNRLYDPNNYIEHLDLRSTVQNCLQETLKGVPYKDPQKQRESRERYRQENHEHLREKYNEWRGNRRAETQKLINEIKSQPCADCGESYPPYVMDFDHVRGQKLFCIATRPPALSMLKILDEIEKCDVVCSNCHRIRTHSRL